MCPVRGRMNGGVPEGIPSPRNPFGAVSGRDDGRIMAEEHRCSVLIVDDQADNRKRWKAAFESADFSVVEAENRIDALSLLRDTATGIDLLVTTVLSEFAGAQLTIEAVEL